MNPKPAYVSMSRGKRCKSTVSQALFPETVIPPIWREVWKFCSFWKSQQVILIQSPISELGHHTETSPVYQLRNNVFQWEYSSNFIIMVKGNVGSTLHKVTLGALSWNTYIYCSNMEITCRVLYFSICIITVLSMWFGIILGETLSL